MELYNLGHLNIKKRMAIARAITEGGLLVFTPNGRLRLADDLAIHGALGFLTEDPDSPLFNAMCWELREALVLALEAACHEARRTRPFKDFA